MKHFLLGTAGHVDHGKTSLIHALTQVDTDRLPEEKERGLSIDLGFAPLELSGPTPAENIAVVIHGLLRPHIPAQLDVHVILAETPRNIVQYPADFITHP